MPLPQRAAGGGYEKWMEEARAGDIVVCKRIRRAPDRTFQGQNEPTPIVVADVLFVTGKRKGEILPAESIASRGFTNELCKVKDGVEVAGKLAVGKSFGNEYPQFNAPSDEDYAKVAAFWEEHDDDPWKAAKASTGAAPDDDEAPF